MTVSGDRMTMTERGAKKARRGGVAILAMAFLGSCASSGMKPISFPADDAYRGLPRSRSQELIVKGGASLVGSATLEVKGRRYPNDCTGLVRAAYAFADIDLAHRFNRYDGNGVRRLYLTLGDEGLLYATRYPAPADLVFWDGTYDANGNGKADDELTHVGLVLSAEPDGTIRYLHYHYRLGPVIERMNLTLPDDDSTDGDGRVNAFMRMKSAPASRGDNAAQLWRAVGKGYELRLP